MSTKAPPPGIYPGVSFDEYCQWDAINHSKLARIDKSPLHARTPVDLSESKSIRFGHLVHSGRLEPDSVLDRYAVMPEFELDDENTTSKGERSESSATTYVKKKRREFDEWANQSRKAIVQRDELRQMHKTLRIILACKEAAECFVGGQAELSIVWQDKETGLLCKARIDYQRPDRLTDLKTSRDDGASPLPQAFEYSLWKYSYYSQAAWYQTGWQELTGKRLPFWFCVVANSEPIQCIAAPVGEVSLMAGRKKNRERLRLWKECEQAGVWPGYASPMLFELPEKYLDGEG